MGDIIEDVLEVAANTVTGFVAGGPAGAAIGAAKGVADVVAGNEAEAEAKREAGAIRAEADIEFQDALNAADLAQEQGEQFLAQQALGISASGIEFRGSPLEVLEETQTGISERFSKEVSRAGRVRSLRRESAARTARAGQKTFAERISSVAGNVSGLSKLGAGGGGGGGGGTQASGGFETPNTFVT